MVWIVGTYATNPGECSYKAKKGQTTDMDNNMYIVQFKQYIYVPIVWYSDSTVHDAVWNPKKDCFQRRAR